MRRSGAVRLGRAVRHGCGRSFKRPLGLGRLDGLGGGRGRKRLRRSRLARRPDGRLLDILDGVYNAIGDETGLKAECEQGRDLGFDGKTLIHPSQLAVANEVFAPTAAELTEARGIIAAFERPENRSRGVIAHEGRMVERMHADMARRTVALAEAIARN